MGIISINNGYHATKVIQDNKRWKFESKIETMIDDYGTGVSINGIKYKVGVGNRDIDLDKSNNIVQLACIEYAVQQSYFEDAKIITSLPVNLYSNKALKEDYTKKIFTLNNKIKDVRIYMEGAAAQLADLNWYKGKLVALLDIGGLTINTMIFEDGKLVPGTQDSFNLGTIILDNKIRTALASNDCNNYTDYQIPYLFNSSNTDIRMKVDETVWGHLEEVRQTLKKKGYPTNIEYRFVGGGALRLEQYLLNFFGGYISEEALWENALGQYALAKAVWK